MNGGFTRRIIELRKFILILVFLAVALGSYSYYAMPKQENPEVSPPNALLTVIYPGASPEIVEKTITRFIEDKVAEITGFDHSESYSKNSASLVVVYLQADANQDKAWSELRSKMDDLQSKLPDGCQKIDINTSLAETAGMIISLSGNGYTYEQLNSYAENMKKELKGIPGVSRFDIDGAPAKEVRVEVNVDKLNQFALSLEDIKNVLTIQNTEIPSGIIQNNQMSMNVTTSGSFADLLDIENTVVGVSAANGSLTRVKDVARVYWADEDSAFKTKENGENAVLLTGYFQSKQNIVRTGKLVDEKLAQIKSGLPDTLKVDKVHFQPTDVSESISNFTANLLEGMVLVIIVVFLGMGLKNAMAVSSAIPLSILITFIVMRLLGIQVHQVSVTALIIALGMLVDDAIVVNDAIQVNMDAGMGKLEACLTGVKQMSLPVLTSTLTTVIAFTPLFIVEGPAGQFMRSIPQVVITSVGASYLIAMTVMPVLAYYLFKKNTADLDKYGPIRDFFRSLLDRGLNNPKKALSIALGAFLVSLGILYFLGVQFFPFADKDVIYINASAETSVDINNTERLVSKVEALLKEEPEVTSYTTAVGAGLPKFYITMTHPLPSKDFAQVMVHLDLKKGKRFKNNTAFCNYFQEKLDREVPGISAKVKQLELAFPYGNPIRVRFSGSDMEQLKEASDKAQEVMEQLPGVIDINDDYEDKVYEFLVKIDSDLAANHGLSLLDIQKQLNIALKGSSASVLRRGGSEFSIVIKSDIRYKEDLENLALKSSITGNKALLKQVATIQLTPQRQTIKKYDGSLAVNTGANIKPGYSASSIENQLAQKLKEQDFGEARFVFDGEKKQITDNFGSLAGGAILAMFIMYVILFLQFRSLVQPLIIYLTIPLAIIGSVLGMFIFRLSLSFTAFLGIVSLIGLVIKNAILLIDYINNSLHDGNPLRQACLDAVNRRFRPIILSSATTIIGLVPLAISGSSLFGPMSVTLMCGLLVSSFLTLVVIPIVYSLVHQRINKTAQEGAVKASPEG